MKKRIGTRTLRSKLSDLRAPERRIKTIRLLFYSTLFISLFSCSTTNRNLIGTWAIDKIEYNGNSILFDLGVNMMTFKSNGQCKLPPIQSETIPRGPKEGKWKIEKDGSLYFLVIETDNIIFKGKYQLEFRKNYEKKALNIFLISSTLSIEGSKFLYNFKENN